jgi:hypothetical protein
VPDFALIKVSTSTAFPLKVLVILFAQVDKVIMSFVESSRSASSKVICLYFKTLFIASLMKIEESSADILMKEYVTE